MRRIGLALSDRLGITAQGIPTMVRDNFRSDLARLTRLAGENDVDLIVAGYPLHMSGDESRQGAIVREFAGKLEERSGIPVRLWDERFTTVVANRVLKESGISQQKRGKAVDRLSAVLILQSYLDAMPRQGGREDGTDWPANENES
ncbi:MAG: Holliday junction resolvase RuvX [Acidobacteria bacterium]|nr:Holliday junction resolvase RuvX [Acidobacteriota bacterium]